jgi:hypothetical protein
MARAGYYASLEYTLVQLASQMRAAKYSKFFAILPPWSLYLRMVASNLLSAPKYTSTLA